MLLCKIIVYGPKAACTAPPAPQRRAGYTFIRGDVRPSPPVVLPKCERSLIGGGKRHIVSELRTHTTAPLRSPYAVLMCFVYSHKPLYLQINGKDTDCFSDMQEKNDIFLIFFRKTLIVYILCIPFADFHPCLPCNPLAVRWQIVASCRQVAFIPL